MNRYILGKRNTTIKLNTDTLDIDYVETSYDIDRMWFIEEDGVLVRKNKEYEVKKVILFYSCIVLEAKKKEISLSLIMMI